MPYGSCKSLLHLCFGKGSHEWNSQALPTGQRPMQTSNFLFHRTGINIMVGFMTSCVIAHYPTLGKTSCHLGLLKSENAYLQPESFLFPTSFPCVLSCKAWPSPSYGRRCFGVILLVSPQLA